MIRFLLALSLVAATSLHGQTAQPSAWVQFPASLTHTLIDTGENGAMRVPVRLAPDSPPFAELKPYVLNVVTTQPHPDDLARQFHLEFDPGDASHGPMLVAIVKPMPDRAGAYTVVAEIRSTKTPAAAQPFELQLDRPAAQLVANSPLIIDQTWTGFTECTTTAPTLNLHERSLRSHLNPLTITDDGEHPSAPHTTSATVKCKIDPGATLGPGGELPLEPVLARRFPLGTTTGKLEISAPQLAEPVVVSYEVHARLHSGWLIAIALLGSTFGYLIRVVLQTSQELAKGRAALLGVAVLVRKERAIQSDTDFQDEVDKVLKSIDTALSQTDPAKLGAAAQSAATSFEAARASLDARHQQLEAELTPLLDLLQTRRPLPPAVAGAAAQCVDALRAAESQLKSGDVAGARRALKTARASVLQQALAAAHQWRSDAALYYDALIEAKPPLLSSAALQFDEAVKTWKGISVILPATDNLTVETLGSALDTLAQSWTSANDVAKQFIVWSTAVLSQTYGALGLRSASRPESLKLLDEETMAFASRVETDLKAPGEAAAGIAGKVGVLRQTWSTALLDQSAGRNLVPVQAALDQGDWLAAARAIAALSVPAQTALGPSPSRLVVFPESVTAPMVFRTVVAPGVLSTLRPVARTQPVLETESAHLRSLREVARAKWLQTVLVALLFSFVAHALFAERFVGTPHDLLAIFFWAFGLDLSVDALVNTAKPIKVT